MSFTQGQGPVHNIAEHAQALWTKGAIIVRCQSVPMTEARRSPPLILEPDGRLRQIVDASARLFDSYGYGHVTMEDIASAVDLRKPTLYHYISSKDDILVLIHQEFMALVLAAARAPERSTLPPRQQVLEIMSDIIGLMHTHRGHVRVFFEHHRELPRQTKKRITALRDEYGQMLEGILSKGVAAGEIRAVDVRLAALAIFGMCNWAYQWYRSDGSLTPRGIALQFCNYIFSGIGAEGQKEVGDRSDGRQPT